MLLSLSLSDSGMGEVRRGHNLDDPDAAVGGGLGCAGAPAGSGALQAVPVPPGAAVGAGVTGTHTHN